MKPRSALESTLRKRYTAADKDNALVASVCIASALSTLAPKQRGSTTATPLPATDASTQVSLAHEGENTGLVARPSYADAV